MYLYFDQSSNGVNYFHQLDENFQDCGYASFDNEHLVALPALDKNAFSVDAFGYVPKEFDVIFFLISTFTVLSIL